MLDAEEGEFGFASTDRLNERARLLEQIPQLLAFLEGFARKLSVFECIFVAKGSTRARRTAVHPATLSTAHCRRRTWSTRARFGPTAWAAQHGPGIPSMVDHVDSNGAWVPQTAFCQSLRSQRDAGPPPDRLQPRSTILAGSVGRDFRSSPARHYPCPGYQC
jgi:hypothetical protein